MPFTIYCGKEMYRMTVEWHKISFRWSEYIYIYDSGTEEYHIQFAEQLENFRNLYYDAGEKA